MDGIEIWLAEHWIELLASLLGILYVLLALKQNIWCWPVGLVNVALYILVFYRARLFGDMVLQGFYMVMAVYGWYNWKYGKSGQEADTLKITKIPLKTFGVMILLTAAASWGFGYVLSRTVSTIPYWDGATTALGLAGTWMTARKYLENWLFWIFTDLLCVGVYFYKGLHLTVVFYAVLAVMAGIAYIEWRKEYKKNIRI